MTILDERLGRPDRAYPSAHIAGTNGKGSTAAFLESILRRAGFRTGLYTSPHLERINERIRIAGEEISDDVFAEIFTRIHHLIEELLATGKLRAHPTYFECLTAMAFEAFARARVDFAVFEVGLGGRLDSTNVIIPAVTLITPIDFDHENFLGHSIREIAGEKAGILKPGVPVVVSPERTEARELILRRAAELGCPVVETETAFRVEHQSSEDGCERALVTEFASFRQFGVAPRLAGRFQLQNALTAAAAARVLAAHGFRIPDEAVSEGIAAAEWSGRLEKVHSQPDVYLDGAHNPAAARELAAFWSQNFAGRKIRLVYGALREKAVDEIAGLLFPRAAEVVFTEPRTTRAISAAQLAEITAHHAQRFAIVPDAEEAFERVLAEAAPRDAIFVTGSLYLVGQIRRFWKNRTGVLAP
ncbi:MAG: hypothetical protein AUI53_01625 [Acidobacteria bacterium 13_1_40CM_2_60_7]|nr:MAG: hypothetical protein AUI53_01625 [Acidobacteria bacterium 13_1_40CM_2_60_7]